MTLLIDIGNSRTKYIFSTCIEKEKCKVINNRQLTVNWLEENFYSVKKIILANVSKSSLTNVIEQWAEQKNIALQVIVSEQKRFGITSFYQQPKQLGIDRWLAILAVANLYAEKNALIIDAGTATTIDLLSSQGQHLGGWILPGINLMFDSLLTQTSRIDAQREIVASLEFGANTSENVNSACWAATIGAIELAINQATKQLNNLDVIIITGGNAENIKALLSTKVLIEDNLIFHGLQRYNSI